MNAKDFSVALGNVRDEFVSEAIAYQNKKKRRSWTKWAAMAACLCLIVAGSFTIGNLLSWRSGCSQIEHNITLVGDYMYYHSNDGVYLYERESMTSQKLADFDGVFTQTKSGLYLLDEESGCVYSVSNRELHEIGTLSPYCVLIDVIENNIFYRTHTGTGTYTIEKLDRTTGNLTEIMSVSDRELIAQKIIDEKLYYYTTDNNGTISALDLQSGENEVIYRSSADNLVFYDDFILLETEQGLFQMSYDTMEPVFISEYRPTSGALDYFNSKLYFQAVLTETEDGSEEAIVSLDLQTKEISIVTQLAEGGFSATYTEIMVCDEGYFYTEPSATAGGLFYRSFDGTEEITISRNRN